MNWSSVKNLLILILVAANVYLICSIVLQDRRRGYIDEDELRDAAVLLADRGLSVELSGIPLFRFSSDIFGSVCSAEDEYYANVAAALSGSERERVHMLLDSRVRIISKNGARTDFSKDFGFSYLEDGNLPDDAYTDITAENFADPSTELDEPGKTRLRSLSRKAAEFLGSRLTDEARPSEDIRLGAVIENAAVDRETGLVYLLVSQRIDGVPIFRHNAVCVFDGDELVAASGRWYFEGIDTSYDCEPSDQVNILFTDLDHLVSERKNSGSEAPLPGVKSMSTCYAIYWNSEKTALYFIPAWQIAHNDGSVIVYNAAQDTQYFSSK